MDGLPLFGIGQGVVVVVLSMILAAPYLATSPMAAAATPDGVRNYTWTEMIRSPIFWVMYAMFVLVGAGGLMATAQLAPIAKDFKIDGVPVSLIGITLPALTFALSIDRILNGVTRPFFGWVSDNIGRENTMLIAFGLEAVGIWMLGNFGHDPVMFVILSGLVFAWGESHNLFQIHTMSSGRAPSTNAGSFAAKDGIVAGPVRRYAGSNCWQLVFSFHGGVNLIAAWLPFI